MRRLLLACVLVASAMGIAAAGPTRKVKVETTPPGASVYIDSIDDGPACEATPCTIDAPVGQPTLIVQLAKYVPEFKSIDVSRGRKPLSVSFTLTGAVGTIVIESPEGARVRINDEDQGKVPLRAEVPAEPVRVLVTLDGKTLYDDFVEVAAGSEQEVEIAEASSEDEGDDDADSDDDETETGGEIRKAVASGPRAHYLQAGLAFDIGFRRFVYSDGTSPFNNSGEVVVGPALELWPGRMLGVGALGGLSLFGRAQFAVSHQKVMRNNMGTTEEVGAETFWGLLELSLRNKWTFGDVLGVEASAGYARDQVEFNAVDSTVLMQVPSADYRSIRLGVRASVVGTVEPYVSAENRVVLSGGNLATRADRAETSAYRLAAGLLAKLGPLGARVEGSYAKYSWTFASDSGTPPPAPGATDKLFYISFVLGYQY